MGCCTGTILKSSTIQSAQSIVGKDEELGIIEEAIINDALLSESLEMVPDQCNIKPVNPALENPTDNKDKIILASNSEINLDPLPTQEQGIEQKNASKFGSKFKVRPSLFVLKHQVTHKKVADYYRFGDLIGKGGYGRVYSAQEKATGQIRAIKIVQRNTLNLIGETALFLESDLLKSIDHPNIVKLYEIFSDLKHYFLVTEYCKGGELFDRIHRITNYNETKTQGYMKQIFSSVSYCHDRRIVHRDLKPENIVFETTGEDSILKIIDFGASEKITDQSQLQKRIGTASYVAPEVLSGQGYDEKCDLWSCGVILYILLSGRSPFQSSDSLRTFQRIMKGDYSLSNQEWTKVSEPAKDLIRKLLVVDPKQRISASEAFNHPWIQGNNSEHPLSKQIISQLITFNVFKKNYQQGKNKLLAAIKQFIAIRIISQTEQGELMKAFEKIDINGDGTLSKEELTYALEKTDCQYLPHQIDIIFEELDVNESGKVDYTEFIGATMRTDLYLTQMKVMAAFRLFDQDTDGFITKQELGVVFEGETIEESEWENILHQYDLDKDGKISESEFLQLVGQVRTLPSFGII